MNQVRQLLAFLALFLALAGNATAQSRNETLQFLFLDGYQNLFDKSKWEIEADRVNGSDVIRAKRDVQKGDHDIYEIVILDNCKMIFNRYEYTNRGVLGVASDLVDISGASVVRKVTSQDARNYRQLVVEGTVKFAKFKESRGVSSF